MKLHLGCGCVKKEGWINVDSQARVNPDVVTDLSQFPWPFESNSADEIYSSHVFEHIVDAVGVMNECFRILKPGGTLEVIVPFAMTYAHMTDPTHCRPWTDTTVKYFLRGTDSQATYGAGGFDLIFCNLLDEGFHVNGTVTPKTLRRSIRN